jgi:phosphate uptake regulator
MNTNVNEMVDSFIVSLQDKAERIQALYDTINELQRKLLEAENELIKLRGKQNDKRNDIVN